MMKPIPLKTSLSLVLVASVAFSCSKLQITNRPSEVKRGHGVSGAWAGATGNLDHPFPQPSLEHPGGNRWVLVEVASLLPPEILDPGAWEMKSAEIRDGVEDRPVAVTWRLEPIRFQRDQRSSTMKIIDAVAVGAMMGGAAYGAYKNFWSKGRW